MTQQVKSWINADNETVAHRDAFKAGRMQRDFDGADIEVKANADAGSALRFPASSEASVERWFGTEVLIHDQKSIRMDRMSKGAVPLLFNHDWSDPIGMVDLGAVRDKRLWVDAHMFKTDRAKEVEVMIAGGLRNVSIGYQLHTVEEVKKNGIFRAIKTVKDGGAKQPSTTARTALFF